MRVQPDDVQFARRQLFAWQAYQAHYAPHQLAALRTVASVIADEPHEVPPGTAADIRALRAATPQHA